MDIDKKERKFRQKEWVANGNLNTGMDWECGECLPLELAQMRTEELECFYRKKNQQQQKNCLLKISSEFKIIESLQFSDNR